MNGVLGMAQMLERTDLDPQQAEMTRIITGSGSALLTIINDVLDFSKIEAGKMSLHPAPMNLREAADDLASLLRVTATERDVTLKVHWDDAVPPCLLADGGRVRQALTNLVGNAVKFTEAGRIDVAVFADGAPGAGGVPLVIEVRDTGVGIPPEAMGRLFGSFEQVGTERSAQGTGLGLAITKALVEAMGGTIEAESEVGRGSVFRIRLVLPEAPDEQPVELPVEPPTEMHQAAVADQAACTAASAAEALTAAPTVGAPSRRLLLVEDNVVNQMVFRAMVAEHGFEVVIEGDGAAGLARARAERFDLIVSDISMPVMDGLEMARRYRAAESEAAAGRPRTPMIALTAHVLAEERERCRAAGFDGFLAKPLRRDALAAALSAQLGEDVGALELKTG